MKVSLPHVVLRGRKYYFRRRIPQELRQFYQCADLVHALKTSDKKLAIALAEEIDASLVILWGDLLDPEKTIIAQGRLLGPKRKVLDDNALRAAGREAGQLWNLYRYVEKIEPGDTPVIAAPLVPSGETRTLSEALTLYLSLNDNGENPRIIQYMNTAVSAVIDCVGDLPLQSYTRAHARKVCDGFLQRMKTRSARVYISRIVSVFNRAIREWELNCSNPFASLDIKGEGRDAKKVVAFTLEELQAIAAACLSRNDDIAWVAGMQLATGARIQEIAGLRVEDLQLDDPIPHIKIREHYDLGRHIKNTGSERDIPLLGVGLWGAQSALASSGGHNGWLVRYGSMSPGNTTNLVNRWLLELTGTAKRSH
jgi:hypothetical protein